MPQFPEDPQAERKRIIKQRNLMLGGLLGAMVVLFYFISIARLGG
ncbi:MAG: hypothetical protein RL671_2301 [Pseudomonadota bacterium]|jgi:hypothetical protein|nr:hypothetical protein [Novosphingobium sp. APW14]MDT9013350.1 hypothetical protein [Novosphingobium sp. APW14]